MKHKFYSLVFFALVSIKLSQQHGTKGGSFSGSFSSSSSSSQSSSHSSSSSGSFSATGSLNEIGAGFKDLVGSLAHSGANAGSFSGSVGTTGGGTGLGGSLGATGSKSGSFANSGSFSSSGAGLAGGVGGVKGNTGVSGTFGGSGGSSISGAGDISCSFGAKNCGSGSGFKTDGTSGSGSGTGSTIGSYGSSISSSVAGSGSAISAGLGNGGFSTGGSGTKGTSGSGLGVGGGIGITGSVGPNGPDSGADKPVTSSSVSQSGSTVKEIPVQENEEGPSGPSSGGNIIGSSQGSTSGGIGKIEPLPLLPTVGSQTKPSQTVKPEVSAGDFGGTFPTGSTVSESSGSYSGGISSGPVPTTAVQPTKGGGIYNSGATVTTGGKAPGSVHISGFPSNVQPAGTGHYSHGSGSYDHVKPVSPGTFGTSGTGSITFGTGLTHGTTGSTNFGSHGGIGGSSHPKKPCCTGPFPGPVGSIHDSKPASSVPPVPTPGGSFPTTGGSGGGVYTPGTGSASGHFPGPVGSIHESKPVSPVLPVPGAGSSVSTSGVNTGVYTQGAGPVSGHFPGPAGSIHESKPVSPVSPVPSAGSSVSTFGVNTGVFTQGTGTISGPKVPCCKGPFPGPTGSIHDFKPASSVPSVTGGSHVTGSTIYGAHGTGHTFGVHGTGGSTAGDAVLKLPCCKPIPPGPIGSIHDSKPATSVSSSGSTGHKYTGPFPGPTGTISATGPVPGTISSSNTVSQGNTQFGTHHTGSYSGTSGWNKHVTSGNDYGTHYHNAAKPAIILHPPVTTGPAHTNAIFAGHKPINPDFASAGGPTGQIGSYKPVGQPGTGSEYTTGTVNVQKSDTNQVQTDKSSQVTGTTSGSYRPSSGTGSGFATGNVEVEKPGSVQSSGNNKPIGSFGTAFGGSFTTGSGVSSTGLTGTLPSDEKLFRPEPKPSTTSGSFGTSGSGGESTYESGFATGNVQIQKPGGIITDGKNVGSGSLSGTATTGTGNFGSTTFVPGLPSGGIPAVSSSGTGFATGNVAIQKPDGSISSGKDIPSGGKGSYSSPVGGESLITTPGLSTSTSGTLGISSVQDSGFATGNVVVQKPDGTLTSGKDSGLNTPYGSSLGSGSFGTSQSGSSVTTNGNVGGLQGSGTFGASGFDTGKGGYTTGSVLIQKPGGSFTSGKDLPSSQSGGISGSGSFGTSGSGSLASTGGHSNSFQGSGTYGPSGSGGTGYATGSVLIHKPDGSVSTGKDLHSGLSGVKGSSGHSFGISGSGAYGGTGAFGLGGDGFEFGHGHGNNAIKGSSGSGSFGGYSGSHSSAGSYSGGGGFSSFGGSKSGSYAGAQSGSEAGYTGLLKNLFGKHGLGGNLGLSGAGSFAKSHSFAGSSSYAGASASSFSGHY